MNQEELQTIQRMIRAKMSTSTLPADEGKPNVQLISKRQRVVEIQAMLHEAEQELRAEEAKGSWVNQLDAKIREAEGALRQLATRYSIVVGDQLTKNLIGETRDFKTAPDEIKTIVKHHERMHALRQFTLSGRTLPQRLDPDGRIVNDGPTVKSLYERAEEVTAKLDALKAYIANEQARRS
jgi:hypothetical protein